MINNADLLNLESIKNSERIILKYQYDVIVIGSGPGGEGAAMKCTKEGLHVAMCDQFAMIGGSCTHKNTIPSKALRQASQVFYEGNS